jgi:hypothetical protein
MGTSVKIIEDHYGHVTPVKNADRILQGLPGWEPIAAAPQEAGPIARLSVSLLRSRASWHQTTRIDLLGC